MGAGIAGGQHAEDDAEGNTVESGTDGIVISQDKQAEDTHVHQESSIAVGGREVGHQVRILQKLPVILGLAAQDEGKNNAQTEQDQAEGIYHGLGSHLQLSTVSTGRQINTHGLEQVRIQEEGCHADGQSSRVQGETLMGIGCVSAAGRSKEADKHTNTQAHNN